MQNLAPRETKCRVGHPQAGLTNALGSAASSLVIYQKAETYSAGQKVIAKSGDTSRSPFLGQISGATGDRYDVANGQFINSKGVITSTIDTMGVKMTCTTNFDFRKK